MSKWHNARIKSLKQEIVACRSYAEDGHACLDMVRERLTALGCCHGHKNKDTPAMFYPEWISCVVRYHVEKALKKAKSDGR